MTDLDCIDPAFGHWLAGFVDGEGSFAIPRPRHAYICSFKLSIRKDDQAILEQCRLRVGVGVIYDAKRKPRRPNENPICCWGVTDKRGARRIVEVFDQFPLRAKKANDFQVWREAVLEWHRIAPGRGTPGTDWSRMAALKQALEDGRRFRLGGPLPVALPEPTLIADPESPRPVGRGSSKYLGVHRQGNSWVAQCRSDGRSRHLGSFETELEAAQVAARARARKRSNANAHSTPSSKDTSQGRDPGAHP